MKNLSNRKAIALALTAGVLGVGLLVVACGGSNSAGSGGNGSGNDSGNPGSGDDGGGTVGPSTATCPTPTLNILFAPMYSSFIAGSTAQTFSIPVVTDDGNTATWSLSDPTQGNILQPQTFNAGGADGTSLVGAMITINGIGASPNMETVDSVTETVGTVIVQAVEGSACGTAVLNITNNTENDWTIGNARYNDGIALHLGGGGDGGFERPEGGFPEGGGGHRDGGGFGEGGMGGFNQSDGGSFFEEEGGTACTNCHGATAIAMNLPFHDVEHTPEQTGGFSDNDLQNIILNGTVPDGGFWDPAVFTALPDGGNTCPGAGTVLGPTMPACALSAYAEWQSFHKWTDITSDELPGVICYLRAITPAPQLGTSNFGGGGGHHKRDGGGPPVADAAGSD